MRYFFLGYVIALIPFVMVLAFTGNAGITALATNETLWLPSIVLWLIIGTLFGVTGACEAEHRKRTRKPHR